MKSTPSATNGGIFDLVRTDFAPVSIKTAVKVKKLTRCGKIGPVKHYLLSSIKLKDEFDEFKLNCAQ